MRVNWGQIKCHEGHLGLVLGQVSSLENILKAENMRLSMWRNTILIPILAPCWILLNSVSLKVLRSNVKNCSLKIHVAVLNALVTDWKLR